MRIAMGTDAGVTPHGQNLRELTLMHEAGMSPSSILRSATGSAAELLGVQEDLGTIEPGKLADLVVVAGDPYDMAGFSDRISGVWKAGTQVAGEPTAA